MNSDEYLFTKNESADLFCVIHMLDQCIFAIHKVSDKPQQLPLVELNLIVTEQWRDILSGDKFTDLEAILERPPFGSVWLTNR